MSSATPLDAIADPSRRRLLQQLCAGPMPVHAISARIGVSVSAVSQHLKVLRGVGLVTGRSDGRRRLYQLAPDALERVCRQAAEILAPPRQPLPEADDDDLVALTRQRAKIWPQLDALDLLLSFRVERLVRGIHRDLQQIASSAGLTRGEMLALGAIAAIGPPYETTASGLKDTLWISLPGIGKRLDGLESRGLIVRRPNPDDRRGQLVRLTERGLRSLAATRFARQSASLRALAQLSHGEKRQLEELVRRWQRSLERAMPS